MLFCIVQIGQRNILANLFYIKHNIWPLLSSGRMHLVFVTIVGVLIVKCHIVASIIGIWIPELHNMLVI